MNYLLRGTNLECFRKNGKPLSANGEAYTHLLRVRQKRAIRLSEKLTAPLRVASTEQNDGRAVREL